MLKNSKVLKIDLGHCAISNSVIWFFSACEVKPCFSVVRDHVIKLIKQVQDKDSYREKTVLTQYNNQCSYLPLNTTFYPFPLVFLCWPLCLFVLVVYLPVCFIMYIQNGLRFTSWFLFVSQSYVIQVPQVARWISQKFQRKYSNSGAPGRQETLRHDLPSSRLFYKMMPDLFIQESGGALKVC